MVSVVWWSGLCLALLLRGALGDHNLAEYSRQSRGAAAAPPVVVVGSWEPARWGGDARSMSEERSAAAAGGRAAASGEVSDSAAAGWMSGVPGDWEVSDSAAAGWMSGWDMLQEQAVSQICRQLLVHFGDASAAMVRCAVKSARPVRICERCNSHFHHFSDAFANLSKDAGNESCSKQLLRSDRLQIVLKTRNFLQQMWTDSECDACLNKNKTAPSSETVNFKKMLNESLNCFEYYSSKHPVHSNYSDLCVKCKGSYNNLTEYYNRMEKDENLCIDIIDAMNLTRQLWSKTYNCTIRCNDMIPVIAVSTFLLFLPVIFYLSSFLHSEQKKLKLIEPKRLKHCSSSSSSLH
ncbi:osteopetrosis-associated transmembrane protein 1 [Rhinoraja longicauda]